MSIHNPTTIDDFIALRRHLHASPELGLREVATSQLVADLLGMWGYEVTRGLAGTGVVGTLRRGSGERSIGIRADMDALPMTEVTGLPYASRTPGVMHACGHDGHTTTLLAAAKQLATNGDFSGTVHLIFQPAEEMEGGARIMVEEGLFERFPCDAVFALHNWPGVPAGEFRFVSGPTMAAVDWVVITLTGKGGHGAMPHLAVDPIVAASSLVMALQTIVSRNIDPLETAVLTVGSIHGGNAPNVIPDSAELQLTLRSFTPEVNARLRQRITELTAAHAASYGVTASIHHPEGFPPLHNPAAETAFARRVAVDNFGADKVGDLPPQLVSEDFAFMLRQRPGSYLFVGNGPSADLHNARYDFNDAAIEPASRYWVKLVEAWLGANHPAGA